MTTQSQVLNRILISATHDAESWVKRYRLTSFPFGKTEAAEAKNHIALRKRWTPVELAEAEADLVLLESLIWMCRDCPEIAAKVEPLSKALSLFGAFLKYVRQGIDGSSAAQRLAVPARRTA